MRSSTRRRLAVVVVAAVALGGCANREQAAAPNPTTNAAAGEAFPAVLTQPDGKQITLEHRPERIVSLSASSTETLFGIGAGRQVVAVDDQSNYPDEAPKTTLSGLTPNVEAIAGHRPDLVVAQSDANELVAGMDKLHTPVLILPSAKTLDDVYAQFHLLGRATGHMREAEELVRRTRGEIDQIVAAVPERARPLTYYHELTTEYDAATSNTFIGQVYGLFRLTNIADPADTANSGGYPKLSPEHIVNSSPDLIFLADAKCCGQNAETVRARPGWNQIKAVQSGNVVPLDDDLASRWGPRIVDLVRSVAEAVTKASQAG